MSKLFEHIPHLHKPRNINETHAQERAQHSNAYTRFNEKAAVKLTLLFSSMGLFWGINIFMLIWIVGNGAGLWHFDPAPYLLLLTVINLPQLPLMPLLAIGQAVLSRKQELQATEQFNTTISTYHDLEQVMQHLSAQDEELLKQDAMMRDILQRLDTWLASQGSKEQAQ